MQLPFAGGCGAGRVGGGAVGRRPPERGAVAEGPLQVGDVLLDVHQHLLVVLHGGRHRGPRDERRLAARPSVHHLEPHSGLRTATDAGTWDARQGPAG